jgi:MFS transporter, DHA2 family, multidrug resistance protein
VLGSVLSAGYLAHRDVSGLPASAATAVQQSVFGGVAIAHQIGSASLLESVRTSFVHGMDMALVVSAGVALAGAVLTLLFLPGKVAPRTTMKPGGDKEGDVVGTR